MKKYFLASALVLALVVSFYQSPTVNAQTTPVCPAGYVCTPVPPCPTGYTCTPVTSLPNCPAGYICSTGTTPTTQTTDATVVVNGTPGLVLSYDSGHKESQLVASIPVAVNGGKNGINVLQRGAAVTLTNGGRYAGAGYSSVITPKNTMPMGIDDSGQSFYTVPAGQSVWFTVTATYSPQQMFAGTYAATLSSVNVNNTSAAINRFYINVPANPTNAVTILGEVSPYITLIGNPGVPGQSVTISGQRLSNSQVYLDGIERDFTGVVRAADGSSITFLLPAGIANGYHSVYVNDPTTGNSNSVTLQVGAGGGGVLSTNINVTINGTPKLNLAYDSNNRESIVGAGWNVLVNGGSTGVNIIRRGAGVMFLDSKGQNTNVNSLTTDITPTDPTGSYTDNFGQAYWVIPAGVNMGFMVTARLNPQQLFAGTYTASLTALTANTSNTSLSTQFSVPVPKNQTNQITVIGEVSPYISSVTSPISGGQTMTITGNRLNIGKGGSNVYIDGNYVPVALVGGDTTVTFTMPPYGTKTALDTHTLYIVDATTGSSNVVRFQYQSTNAGNCYTFTTNMTVGSTGVDVAALQTYLLANGYDIPEISSGKTAKGYFGPSTATAVSKFQAAHGLPATGFVGALTRAALNSCKGGGGTVSQVNISLDPSSPLIETVPVTDTTNAQYLGLPALIVDLNAQNADLRLRSLNVHFMTSGAGTLSAAYLYQGSTQVASASVVNGVVQFMNITPGTVGTNIPMNTSVPFTVKVDVTGVSGAGLTLTPSIASNDIGVSTNSDNIDVSAVGSATGNAITVVGTGAFFTLANTPTLTSTNITPGGSTVSQYIYRAQFNIGVQAIGADVLLGLPGATLPMLLNGPKSFFICKNGVLDTTDNFQSGVNYSQPTQTTISSDGRSFTVSRNSMVTIPVTFQFLVNGGGADTYQVHAAALFWSSNGQTQYTDMSSNKAWQTGTCNGSGPTGSAQANISLDPASPLTQTVPVTDTTNGQYLGLPVLTFDVNAQNDSLHLHDVKVSFAISGTGRASAAYLYQGSTQVASASVSNGQADFANITDGTTGASIPVNTSVPFTVKVDVTGVTAPTTITTITANTSNLIVYDSKDNVAVTSGSANGNAQTVVGSGPLFSLASTPWITTTNITPPGTSVLLYRNTAQFNVTVQAVGTDVTLGLPNAKAPAFGGQSTSYTSVYKNGAEDPSYYPVMAAYSQPTNTTISSDGTSFTVARNQMVTIPVTYVFSSTGAASNVCALQLKSIVYSTPSEPTGVRNFAGQPTWRTVSTACGNGLAGTTQSPYVTIAAIKNNQSLPNNSTINIGDTFQIQGAPYNISGQTRAFFFDPIFNGACTNNGSAAVYELTCTAIKAGTSNFHIEMYLNGQTYSSSIFTLNVAPGTSGQSPVISNLIAPTQLTVNQTGTWTLSASDPANGSLSYGVSWGDGSGSGAGGGGGAVPQFVQQTSYTHSYSTAGTYTVTFTVTNGAGLSAKSTATVNVVSSTLTCPVGYTCTSLVNTVTTPSPTPYPTYSPTPYPTYSPTPTPYYAPTPYPTYSPTPTPYYAPTPTPTPVAATCPAGYICTTAGTAAYCPTGYTCNAATSNCPSGYTCRTYSVTPTPTPTPTPYSTYTSPTASPSASPHASAADVGSGTATVWDAIWTAIGACKALGLYCK